MHYQAFATGFGIFLANAFLFPIMAYYRRWKASRSELQLRRDRHGRLVPDLRLKRAETAAKVLVVLLFVAVIVVGLAEIMPDLSKPYKPEPPLPAGYKMPDGPTPPPLYYQPKPAAPAAQ